MLLVTVAAVQMAYGRSAARRAVRERVYRANNWGVAQIEQLKHREAADALSEALRIDDSLAFVPLNLSLALQYAHDLRGAGREATDAARISPDAAQPAYSPCLIARAENRTSDALRAFERVHHLGRLSTPFQRQSQPPLSLTQKSGSGQTYPDNIPA